MQPDPPIETEISVIIEEQDSLTNVHTFPLKEAKKVNWQDENAQIDPPVIVP